MTAKNIQESLAKKINSSRILPDCDMSQYTSFRAGGRAAFLILPETTEELKFALTILAGSGLPYLVMGNGSNLLVRDGGYQGAIVKLGEAFSWTEVQDGRITAGSGSLLSAVAQEALKAGLTGFEFACGIPGSLGGAVFMNAGAYDGELARVIREAGVVSKDGGREYTLSREELDLGYRHSALQDTGDVVVSATLQLQQGDSEAIRAAMEDLMARRNARQPLSFPSAGSFFKRPEGYFAGKLIHDAGLSGLSVGGAQVSTLHNGFLVNADHATATDIIRLMTIIQATVLDEFGVTLEPEVRIIGE